MSLRATLLSFLNSGKKTAPAVRNRTNVATQVVKNKGINARVSTSTTVTAGNTRARISTTGNRVRVTGSTRINRGRINFGF